MAACIFCEIAAQRAPAAIVYEDSVTLAFMDLYPLSPGHSLVIPRAHYIELFDLSREAGAAVMQTAQKVARALKTEFQPDGMNILHGSGRAAGQTVFHFHLHLVPRREGDHLFRIAHPRVAAELATLSAHAARVRQHL